MLGILFQFLWDYSHTIAAPYLKISHTKGFKPNRVPNHLRTIPSLPPCPKLSPGSSGELRGARRQEGAACAPLPPQPGSRWRWAGKVPAAAEGGNAEPEPPQGGRGSGRHRAPTL